MISSRLRARWRALTVVLGLDLLRSEPDLHARPTQAAVASALAHDKHADSAAARPPRGVR